jgi:hypothetical protein
LNIPLTTSASSNGPSVCSVASPRCHLISARSFASAFERSGSQLCLGASFDRVPKRCVELLAYVPAKPDLGEEDLCQFTGGRERFDWHGPMVRSL